VFQIILCALKSLFTNTKQHFGCTTVMCSQ
jgi:hypothetical protein